jgi:hypothetical protein
MKSAFQFRVSVARSGEILTQPATFLPGESRATRPATGFFRQNLNHLPIFGGVLNFSPAINVMAQPLLKGGLQ